MTRSFDLMYAQAVELGKAFPDFQFKTVTALSVFIGWMVTSDGAQNFVAKHSDVSMAGASIAFGFLILFQFIWILGHYKLSQGIFFKLVELAAENGISDSVIDVLKPRWLLVATYLVVNLLLCSAAITTVGLLTNWGK